MKPKRSASSSSAGPRGTRFGAAAAKRALADTLLELPADEVACEGEAPFLVEVLHEARLAVPPVPSRLPALMG